MTNGEQTTDPAAQGRQIAALKQRLRRASAAVYLATEESVADDLSAMLREAASALEAAEATAAELREALVAVQSTSRAGCWCDSSWDVQREGHQAKCRKATAALAPPEARHAE